MGPVASTGVAGHWATLYASGTCFLSHSPLFVYIICDASGGLRSNCGLHTCPVTRNIPFDYANNWVCSSPFGTELLGTVNGPGAFPSGAFLRNELSVTESLHIMATLTRIRTQVRLF